MKPGFFVFQGLLFIAVAIAGFGTSITSASITQTQIPAIAWMHAAVMLGWLVLYLVQAGRIAAGNASGHRRLGGWAVAAAVLTEMAMAGAIFSSFRLPLFEDPSSFIYIVTLFELEVMVLFAVFLFCGLRARQPRERHSRWMTFATLIIVQPAVDRLSWFLPQLLVLRIFLVILPLAVYDLIVSRRIHPVTLMGAGVVFVCHAAVIAFSVAGGQGWRLWLRAATEGLR
jgi:hypothetical protein